MKLTTFLLIVSLFQIQANNSYSQNAKVTLNLENVSLESVFKNIEALSEFKFLYNHKKIDVDKIVSINANKIKISDILKLLLSDTDIAFTVNNKHIILKHRLKESGVQLLSIKKDEFSLQKITVKGTITDDFGAPLPGANILEKGTSNGIQTDFDGNFTLDVSSKNAVLVITYVGFKTQEIVVGTKTKITVKLVEDAAGLDEVVIVSFGKQKKASVVASITTIKPSELNIPSSNLTTALAGRVSGLISYQRSGEPGADNAEFFIRGITSFGAGGNSPLILIDGIELDVEDLARLNPDDIASFSILKDASAAALYGARGANGVVYVTTKEGVEGPVRVNFRAETKMSSSTSDIELADPVTYMRLFNEGIRTRDALEAIPFSQAKIENTIAGTNPLLYPTVDWQKELFKKTAINKSYNFSVNGGGKTARYYVSAAYTQDTGILNVPQVSNFNSNIDLKKFQLRSNTNINLTPTSTLKLAFNAAFDDYNGPRQGGSQIYARSLTTSPVLFQPFYQPDEGTKYAQHILFGNALAPRGNGFYFNPYADLVTGYKEDTNSTLIAQVEFNQDFGFITEGLSLKGVVSSTRKANYSISRGYDPFYYTPLQNRETKEVALFGLNPDFGSTTLSFESAPATVDASTYAELRVNYSREFDKHAVGGLLVHTINDRVLSVTDNDLQASLPFRNQGISGRFTYGYDDKYFAELNFGYNGSERFAKSERWGFFPSAAAGWIASNEKFLSNVDFLDNLKFKASYGLVGNDQIGDSADRFFYISNVLLNERNKGFQTGSDFSSLNFIPGVGITRYGNDQITWETGHKLNVGLELGLFNALTVEVDVFSETRTNILSDRIIPASLGLQAAVRANIGEAKSHGVDATLIYNKSFSQDFWLEGRVNFTYATNEITKTEEPDYSETPWRSKIGQPISQPFGYVAERLFIDQEEVNNSPTQFGEYTGGDIKYKDIDGNGVINTLDQVPIGNPTDPEIIYGMGFSIGYKGIDFSCFFQGSANSSFFIDTRRANPFVSYRDPDDVTGGTAGAVNNQLLKVWADSHWSEDNRDIYAKWPRLSGNENFIENNLQPSTWFLQDGSFLRLKSIELGYNLPKDITTKLGLQKLRIYTSATNLMYFSKFKLWDPELAGNGFRYPLQRVMNLGINISI